MPARVSTFAFAVMMSAGACKEDKTAARTTSTTESASAVANAEPSAVPGGHHGHRACPSRVRGATASASDVDGGVMISVTGNGDAMIIAEIQSRANALGTLPPDGRRGRFCPEMEEGTSRTVTSTKTGADITLVPTNASDLARVRNDVRDHLEHAEKRPD